MVIDKMSSTRSCIFLDYVPDAALPALYSAATAFIYPSLYEGFGFPIIEAMACGVPVISSNNSSMKEIAENAAILIDHPEDDRAIVYELNRIAEDRQIADTLISAGLERSKHYTAKNMAVKMLALYHQLMSEI